MYSITDLSIYVRWLCLAGLIFMVACTTQGPRQTDEFRPEGTFSSSGEAALPDLWWQTFDDDVLNGLVEMALANNLTLQATWDRLDQARALARRAGAELWPQMDGEAGFSSTQTEIGSRKTTTDNYRLGLAATYEIDLWGRIRSGREAARLEAQSSAEDLRTAAITLSAQVATTWFQILEQGEELNILRQQLLTNQQTLELVTLQFRTGQVGIADLLQQRQVVESRRGEMALANARKIVLQNQLSILLGAPPGEAEIPDQSGLGPLPPLPTTGLRSDLLQRRPDIRASWLQLQAADQRVAAAVADRFPRLSLNARTTTSEEDVGDLFNNWLTTLSANLLGPIIDGGRRRAEVDRTQAVAEEALHVYGQTVLDAVGEVEDALTREQRQRTYLSSLNQQLRLATQATERIRERYLNGAEDYQRVLISILSEQQLQLTRLDAQSDLYTNRVLLCRALAGGWDMTRRPMAR